MKTQLVSSKASEAGYTLLTTMLLAVAAAVLMAGTLGRTYSGSKLNDRNNAYIAASAVAEAATEKTMARMMVDFANGGEQMLSNNLDYYRSSLLPTTNDSSFFKDFVISDGQGTNNKITVIRTTTSPNPPYVTLETQYPGMNAFAATYRILAAASLATNSTGFNYYKFTNVVCQDVQMAEIPVFQFAIFYDGLLEFTDCAPLNVNGRVHCNSNIYVGCPSGSSVAFNYFVTAHGTITNPAWFGYAQSSYSASSVTYNGTPTPGWGTGEPALTMPIGTNNSGSGVQQILYPPAVGEATTNPISSQRFYNKAYLLVTVTDTNILLNFKNSMYDPGTYLSNNGSTGASLTNWTNNTKTGFFLNITNTFYEAREGRTNHVAQIDVGLLGTWLTTNTNCTAKWANTATPFNGIMYVQDLRTTNTHWMNCVRLTNGLTLANSLYTNGLTVATPNPLYCWGNYNCPGGSTYLQSTNVTTSRPASFICDAFTVLSASWKDSQSTSLNSINATSTTINAAIMTGNVPSTGSSATQFSGGVHNLPRLLENWTGDTLWLNTSMICLYPSAQATQQFQKPGIYYNAPNRMFLFNQNYTTSTGLPPGTPQMDLLIRATWWTPRPGDPVTNTLSPNISFVPQ